MTPSAVFGQLKDAQGNIISPIAFANEDAITTSFVTAPNLNTDTNGSPPGEPGQWLKVEFHYGTTPVVTSAYPYVDSAEFKVWIEGLDQFAPNPSQPSGKGVAVALTGSVTYLNIPMGKDIYGVFYVHPSVLARYSSDRGYEDFDRKFDIHIEAYVGGVLVDEINKNKEDDPLKWFQPLKPIPNLVYRQDQCSFLISNPDRYPMIKLPAPAP
jgi:hypothetical protein